MYLDSNFLKKKTVCKYYKFYTVETDDCMVDKSIQKTCQKLSKLPLFATVELLLICSIITKRVTEPEIYAVLTFKRVISLLLCAKYINLLMTFSAQFCWTVHFCQGCQVVSSARV